jgi:hypothetical protein
MRDWLLYVAIALFIVLAIWTLAVHQAGTGGFPDLPLKWLGFAGMTWAVFGSAIRACRRWWREQKFWVFLGFFLAVHSGLGVLVLMRIANVPLLLYALLTGPEYLLLAKYLGFFLNRDE